MAIGDTGAHAGLKGCDQPWGLKAHQGLGGGVEVAKLLVKQFHRLTRELGEDVPVHVSTEPGEAGKEEEREGEMNSLRAVGPLRAGTEGLTPAHPSSEQVHFLLVSTCI
jgi:hypothetical protein